jgi:hypothetical protein
MRMAPPCLGILAAALLSGAAQADTWYTITAADGTHIGYACEETMQGEGGLETVQTQEIDVAERPELNKDLVNTVGTASQLISRTVTKEDSSGRPLLIVSTSRNGRDWSRTEAVIGSDSAAITRSTSAETRKMRVALPADVRFDNGDGLLASWNPAATPRLEFENFNVDAMTIDRVTIEAAPRETALGAEGKIAALRKRYDGTELRSIARIVVGPDGHVVEAVQPLFGSSIHIAASDRATAMAPHPYYRVLPTVMTKSPFVIGPAAMRGHIRYRFAFKDGIAFQVPQTGEQRVRAEPGFVTLDVCDDCGPGLATDRATLDDALKPTAWLQSDAPQIKALVEHIARMKASDSEKMEMLRVKAKPYLGRVDFAGHYSALETMARRAGDCTEASVLLAAFGRAAGIPTRVVNGLVYSRESYHGVSNVFMPHSWTLAFADGKWRSFDLALDKFDSTHIALTVGDGDERSLLAAGQLAGLLEWKNMAEVRTAP